MSRLPYHKTIIAVSLLGFLLCMALIFACCASSTTGKALNVGVLASKGADFASTRYGIQRGGVEANPVNGSSVIRQAVVSVLGVSTVLVLSQAVEQEHKVLAQVIRSTAIVGWSLVAYHNVKVIR